MTENFDARVTQSISAHAIHITLRYPNLSIPLCHLLHRDHHEMDDIDWPVVYQRIRTSFSNALADPIVNKLRKEQFNRASFLTLLRMAEHKSDDPASLDYLHKWSSSDSHDIIPPPKRGPGRPPKSSLPEDEEVVDIPYKHVWKTGLSMLSIAL